MDDFQIFIQLTYIFWQINIYFLPIFYGVFYFVFYCFWEVVNELEVLASGG